MGLVLLGLFAAAEGALLIVTCMRQKEKEQWLRNRWITGTVQMGIFMLALLFPQAAWDFRFKLCFAVLFIRLAAAVMIYLLKRRRTEAGRKSKAGAVFSAAGGVLMLGLSLIPAFLFTGYQGLDTTGDYGIRQASAILVDEARVEDFETDGSKREVPVHIYYPDAEKAGKNEFPLVIFSHGAFGYYQSNASTYMELASNGYVVISLDHPYHSFFTEDTNGQLITVNPRFLQEVMWINQEEASEEKIMELSHKWLAIREADMNLVLDSVKEAKAEGKCTAAWYMTNQETETEIEKVFFMADTDRIGVMGHSLGGAASVSMGRKRQDVDAVIDIDGTMLGEELSYEDGSYVYYDEAYPVPLLDIANEEHHRKAEEEGTRYVNRAVLEKAVDGRHTWFLGSGHMNFTDLPLFSPPLAKLLGTGSVDETECIETMNQLILEYFNCYLKGEGEPVIKDAY